MTCGLLSFLLWEVLQMAAVFKAIVSEIMSASFCMKQKNEMTKYELQTNKTEVW